MKVITIKQPWATLIAKGYKEYEFRTWKTKHRGDILIHAGKGIATKLIEYVINNYKDYSIFSCVDLSNISSLRLHNKNGFVPLYEFEEKENNHVSAHVMMMRIEIKHL